MAIGRVSSTHIQNFSDLIERVKSMDVTEKKLASFEVKVLFTSVPVQWAMEAVIKVVDKVNENVLPMGKEDYIKLVSLCMRFGCFTFDGQECVQHKGLAMGFPLSAVMASLFMELLEEEEFIWIMGRGLLWFRYVDDTLVVVWKSTDVENKVSMLNCVNEYIQFTVEEETEGKLPFLNTKNPKHP